MAPGRLRRLLRAPPVIARANSVHQLPFNIEPHPDHPDIRYHHFRSSTDHRPPFSLASLALVQTAFTPPNPYQGPPPPTSSDLPRSPFVPPLPFFMNRASPLLEEENPYLAGLKPPPHTSGNATGPRGSISEARKVRQRRERHFRNHSHHHHSKSIPLKIQNKLSLA